MVGVTIFHLCTAVGSGACSADLGEDGRGEALVSWGRGFLRAGGTLKGTLVWGRPAGPQRLCLLSSIGVCVARALLAPLTCPAALPGLTPFLHKDTAGGCVDAVAGGPAHFECETSEAHVSVHWYKDGMELNRSSQRFLQEDVGSRHRLVATSVTRQDEGTYSCRVGEDSVDFQLRVSGEPQPLRHGGWGAGLASSSTCEARLASPSFLPRMPGRGHCS